MHCNILICKWLIKVANKYSEAKKLYPRQKYSRGDRHCTAPKKLTIWSKKWVDLESPVDKKEKIYLRLGRWDEQRCSKSSDTEHWHKENRTRCVALLTSAQDIGKLMVPPCSPSANPLSYYDFVVIFLSVFLLPLFELLYLSEYFKNILMGSDEHMKVIIMSTMKQHENYRRI